MKEKRLLLRKTVIQQLRRLLEPALVIIKMHHDGDKLRQPRAALVQPVLPPTMP